MNDQAPHCEPRRRFLSKKVKKYLLVLRWFTSRNRCGTLIAAMWNRVICKSGVTKYPLAHQAFCRMKRKSCVRSFESKSCSESNPNQIPNMREAIRQILIGAGSVIFAPTGTLPEPAYRITIPQRNATSALAQDLGRVSRDLVRSIEVVEHEGQLEFELKS